jgi:hypothetical protein
MTDFLRAADAEQEITALPLYALTIGGLGSAN